jgi:hypothetical protein
MGMGKSEPWTSHSEGKVSRISSRIGILVKREKAEVSPQSGKYPFMVNLFQNG